MNRCSEIRQFVLSHHPGIVDAAVFTRQENPGCVFIQVIHDDSFRSDDTWGTEDENRLHCALAKRLPVTIAAYVSFKPFIFNEEDSGCFGWGHSQSVYRRDHKGNRP